MSVAKFDKWQWTDGTDRNHIVQVATASSTAIASVAYVGQSTVSLGATSGYTAAPTSTSGSALVTMTFQPKQADSIILVQSSSVDVSESSNSGDDFRIFAHADTTLLCWAYSGMYVSSFANYYQGSNLTLYGFANSWGTTARTIRLGVDYTGGTAALFINTRYNSSWLVSPIVLTITEIAV